MAINIHERNLKAVPIIHFPNHFRNLPCISSICCFSERFLTRITTRVWSPINKTFILGAALLKMVTWTVTLGTALLIFCRVDANFLARGAKKSGGPEPPPEVVLACLKSGPCAEKIFCGVESPRHWRRSSRFCFTNAMDTDAHKRSRHPKYKLCDSSISVCGCEIIQYYR